MTPDLQVKYPKQKWREIRFFCALLHSYIYIKKMFSSCGFKIHSLDRCDVTLQYCRLYFHVHLLFENIFQNTLNLCNFKSSVVTFSILKFY